MRALAHGRALARARLIPPVLVRAQVLDSRDAIDDARAIHERLRREETDQLGDANARGEVGREREDGEGNGAEILEGR